MRSSGRTTRSRTSAPADSRAPRSSSPAVPPYSDRMTQPWGVLLFWDGCPSYPDALEELRAAMADLGLDPDTVLVREVDTDQRAERELFGGSPTIGVDGDHSEPPGDERTGFTCRVYRLRDGRF